MEFSDNDFRGLRYNCYQLGKSIDLVKTFPHLGELMGIKDLKKEHEGIPKNAILRYIIYMYDPETPLKSIPSLIQRKQEAAILAGMPIGKEGFPQEVKKIIFSEDKEINLAIVGFVIDFNSATYSKLVAFEHSLSILLAKMMNTGPSRDNVKMIEDLEQGINSTKKRLIDEMSGGLNDTLYAVMSSERLMLRPEDIARKLEDGEEPVDIHPYGDDYSFEKYPWKNVTLLSDTQDSQS